jgi:iron complex outermembrane receptor protein
MDYHLRKWKFRIEGQYAYTRSTNQKSKFPGDASVGKQLIYTPKHRAAGVFRVSWQNFLLSYSHQYTGIRYLSSNNNELLQAFNTGDIQISKNFHLTHTDLAATFSIDNLWNHQYLIIAGMPMPGRSFRLTLTFQFHKPLTSHIK